MTIDPGPAALPVPETLTSSIKRSLIAGISSFKAAEKFLGKIQRRNRISYHVYIFILTGIGNNRGSLGN